MSFLERRDNAWLDAALDPQRRGQRIATLASNRLNMVWVLVLIGVVCTFTTIGQVSGRSPAAILPGLVFLTMFFGFAEIQRELRLLKLVGRMQPTQELEPLSSSVE